MAPLDRQFAQGPSSLQARPRLRRPARRRGRHRRRVHRPVDDRPPVVRRAAPGRRGQGAGQDQGGEPDARHHHPAELLQALQETVGNDRHRHDRGDRVLQGLRPRRPRHPDQPVAGRGSIIPTSFSGTSGRSCRRSSTRSRRSTPPAGRSWSARRRSRSRKSSPKCSSASASRTRS